MNDFAEWMKAMGFNGKQVTEAGARIGLKADVTGLINREKREPTLTERLAMAAVRAGLPAWTPETDEEIADTSAMRRIISRAAARGQQASDSDETKAA